MGHRFTFRRLPLSRRFLIASGFLVAFVLGANALLVTQFRAALEEAMEEARSARATALVAALRSASRPSLFEAWEGVGVAGEGALLVDRAGNVLDAAGAAVGARTVPDLVAADPSLRIVAKDLPGTSRTLVVAGRGAAASSAYRVLLGADVVGLAAAIVVSLGITVLLVREAAARERAEHRLVGAIENAPSSVALFDADDRLVVANDAFRRELHRAGLDPILGLDRGAIAGALVAVASEAATDDPTRESDACPSDRIERMSDGRWILTRERRTPDGATVVFRSDVTALKTTEEALRRSARNENEARLAAEAADRSKLAFIATMGHELRTPLNAVVGFSDIIANETFGPGDPRYREYAGLIARSGRHLLTLINELLEFAKTESGKVELSLEPLDAVSAVREAVEMLGAAAETGRVELSIKGGNVPVEVLADRTRLRQVLLNLLSNAVKFTPPGGRVVMTVREAGDMAEFSVADTGIGIPAEDIARVFEPFGQARGAGKRAVEGTGLGLPVAKRLVELHGGTLSLESAPGRGTVVRFSLRLARVPSQKDAAAAA